MNMSKLKKHGIIVFVLLFLMVTSTSLFCQEYIKTFGYDDGNQDGGFSIIKSFSEENQLNFYIAGFTNQIIEYMPEGDQPADALIMKIAATPFTDPNYLWGRRIFAEEQRKESIAYCIREDGSTTPSKYVFCGRAPSPNGDANIMLGKLNNSGGPNFLYNYDVGFRGKIDVARDMIIDDEESYVIVGSSASLDSSRDIIISKFDNTGNHIWLKYLGFENTRDIGRAIIQDKDTKNYVVLGYTEHSNNRDLAMAIYSRTGTLINSVVIDGTKTLYG